MYHGDLKDNPHPRYPGELSSYDRLVHLINGYDTAIRYVDDQVARIVKMLKDAGVYDDTVIVISADHGENFGQLGIYTEHGTADDGTCHIPMIVKYPGKPAGKTDAGLHYHLDWAPTLMDLMGRDKPQVWSGESYVSAFDGAIETGRDQLVISQCAHVCQRSVRWDKVSIHADVSRRVPPVPEGDGVRPRSGPDGAARPRGVAPRELCKEGMHRLAAWHDEQMMLLAQSSRPDKRDPLWTVISEGGPFSRKPDPRRPRRLQGLPRPPRRTPADPKAPRVCGSVTRSSFSGGR